MGFLDKYLADEHADADESFREGKDGDGKKDDDIIGYIHDLLQKHDTKLDELLKRTEHLSDSKQEEMLKTEEKKEDKEGEDK